MGGIKRNLILSTTNLFSNYSAIRRVCNYELNADRFNETMIKFIRMTHSFTACTALTFCEHQPLLQRHTLYFGQHLLMTQRLLLTTYKSLQMDAHSLRVVVTSCTRGSSVGMTVSFGLT